MDYIIFKLNFICKLKLQFEISNCNFNLQLKFTHVHDIHYMIFKWNFNLQLKLNVGQVHLKGKVFLVYDMDYIVFKFNFICKLKLQFEISNCNFNLEFQFTHVHDIRYMNLKLQFKISYCNFNLQLKLNVGKIHLKGKVSFNLAYGLHHFQIEFRLEIEIAI